MFFKRADKAGDKLNVIRMEKLESVKDDSDLDHTLSHVIYMLRKLKISSLTPDDTPELMKKLQIDKPMQGAGFMKPIKPDQLNAELSKLESLIKMIIDVWKHVGSNNPNFGEDLYGNIMLRGSVPVIADPYYTKHNWKMTASDMLDPSRTARDGSQISFKTGRSK